MPKKREQPYGADLTPVDSLDSLFGSAVAELVSTKNIKTRSQPRRYFDPEKLEQLIQSVKQHGILEPLLVRPIPKNQYELVAGERRYRAAVALKLELVPVVIKELSEQEALQVTLVENLQREDLNPVDETEGVLQLLSLHLGSNQLESRQLLYQMKNAIEKKNKQDSEQIAEQSLARDNVIPNSGEQAEQTVQSVFEMIGQNWYSFTCNRLPLLNLPQDILEVLREGKIEYTKAKALASLKDEETRKELMEQAIAKSLSLREIKERIKAVKPQPQKEEIFNRLDNTYKQVKKSKKLILGNARKRKKLESLLAQIEKLFEVENKR
ncbi:MAG: ParB/RepB/Spo0J family partition protein [Xenococcaceae cyanobacterium MO_167.B27]|nr:ParB/RepB/Spo0J family partition protein [Xenococcaceae cyanobacterium MO_167.B27]